MFKQNQSNFVNRSSRSILMSHGHPQNQLSRAKLTNSWQMLDSFILTFSKEGMENVLVSLSSLFDAFVFSYCCCAPFTDKHSCQLVKQKGI